MCAAFAAAAIVFRLPQPLQTKAVGLARGLFTSDETSKATVRAAASSDESRRSRVGSGASSDESRSPVAHRDRCACRSSCEPCLPSHDPHTLFYVWAVPVLLARCRHVPGCNAVIFAGGRPPAVMPSSAGGALCMLCMLMCRQACRHRPTCRHASAGVPPSRGTSICRV